MHAEVFCKYQHFPVQCSGSLTRTLCSRHISPKRAQRPQEKFDPCPSPGPQRCGDSTSMPLLPPEPKSASLGYPPSPHPPPCVAPFWVGSVHLTKPRGRSDPLHQAAPPETAWNHSGCFSCPHWSGSCIGEGVDLLPIKALGGESK